MNIKENISIAIYSIRTHMMRSLLTMLGVIIGVFSVIAIITVGNGGRDYIVGMIRDMGQSMINIYVDTVKADASQYITRADIAQIKARDDIRYVSPRVSTIGSVNTSTESGFAMVYAGTPDLRFTSSVEVVSGRFFNEEEYKSASRVCLVAKLGTAELFGQTDVVGQYVDFSLNGQTLRLRVIGLVDYNLMGRDSGSISDMLSGSSIGGSAMPSTMTILMMPSTLTDMMMNSNGAYDGAFIIAKDERQLDSVGNAAINMLYTNHNNRGTGVYSASNMATYIDLLDKIISILTTFIAGVSAISLVVGGIGVMNIMLVSVTERTREIGIRKALGARTGSIMFQFLTESVILCLIGGVIGFILGVAGAGVVAMAMKIPIAMKGSTVAIAIGFSSAIGMFFGIYPARRAAKMLPIEALRRDD